MCLQRQDPDCSSRVGLGASGQLLVSSRKHGLFLGSPLVPRGGALCWQAVPHQFPAHPTTNSCLVRGVLGQTVEQNFTLSVMTTTQAVHYRIVQTDKGDFYVDGRKRAAALSSSRTAR